MEENAPDKSGSGGDSKPEKKGGGKRGPRKSRDDSRDSDRPSAGSQDSTPADSRTRNESGGDGPPRRNRRKRRGNRRRRGSGDRQGGEGQGQGGQGQGQGQNQAVNEEDLETRVGLIELMNEGYGFLRFVENYYLPDEKDVYVSANLVRKYGLRPGSMVKGDVAPPRKRGQKPTLHRITEINEKDPELHRDETLFKNLVPCDPYQRLVLEQPPESDESEPDTSMRIVDLLTPIGRGQRALIVAPPRTGKTVIMQKMANAIAANDPDVKVIILLIDERPEEVTDMKRNTSAEVIASCLDEGTANHVRVTELVLDKVRRLVEAGDHVVCLLDSITRLGRAYNNETKHSGRILSGGVDAKTLAKPKAFFGAARTIEDGGSLTIIATALIETGSRMDQVIFEEFKGTGNMELVLSRQLANNRIFPAIDIAASGTRKEEKLLSPETLKKVTVLRRVLNQLNPNEAMRLLIDRMGKTRTNEEFLAKFDLGD